MADSLVAGHRQIRNQGLYCLPCSCLLIRKEAESPQPYLPCKSPAHEKAQPEKAGLDHWRIWSGRSDSNTRPLAPHASALPDCATPRLGVKLFRVSRKLRGIYPKLLNYGSIWWARLRLEHDQYVFQLDNHLPDHLLVLLGIVLDFTVGEAQTRTADGEALVV